MKKIIIFFAALAALLSCTKENPSNYNPVDGTYSVTLSASAPGADTKTTLVDGEGTKFVLWTKGDAIKVLFFPITISHNAAFSGSNGIFDSQFDDAKSASANFTCDSWSWGSKVSEQGVSASLNPEGIALYPATVTATSNKPLNKYVNANTELYFVLPSTQNAIKGNIESNLNFSYATIKLSEFENTISNGARTDLTFNNACAMIELTMPSILDKKVTSISIASNSGVSLTGKGNVKLTSYQNVVDSPFGVDVTDGSGVTLNNAQGFEPGAKYYVVVWPGEHTSGLTIDFTAEDGTKATKTTPGVTLSASKVKPYTFNKGLDFTAPVKEYNYIYADGSQGNEERSDVVGVIFFLGNPREQFNNSEMLEKFTGLAISLKDYDNIYWGTSSNTAPNWKYPSSVGLVKGTVANYNVGGFNTRIVWLTSGYNNLDIYKTNYGTLPEGVSSWYLPAPIEWKYIAENLSKINSKLSAVGGQVINLGTSMADGYWLPLAEANSYDAYVVHGPENSLYFEDNDWTYKYSTHKVRPIFAF